MTWRRALVDVACRPLVSKLIPHDVLYLVPLYRAETLMSILHSNTRCQLFASYILNHALTPHVLEPVEPSREGGMWSVESGGGMWSLESERGASLSSWHDGPNRPNGPNGPTASTDDLNSSNSLLHHRQETNAAANPPRITCLPRNTDRGGSRWLVTDERYASSRGVIQVKRT